MELWIRSQDKQKLAKVNELNILGFDNFVSIRGCINQETSSWLGNYKTKERALEVLDEIQNILNPMLIFKNCECTKDVLDSIKEVGACIVHDNAKLEQINICVFEMPEV